VVEGCNRLEMFDVSQCKNLQRWLDGGGEERSRRVYGRKKLKFETKRLVDFVSGMSWSRSYRFLERTGLVIDA